MNSLDTLEYHKLLALIARYAQTPMGRHLLEDLQPLTSRRILERDLEAISETIKLNEEKQVSWSFSDIFEPFEAIAILKIQNATLEPTVLLELTRLCNQALFARSIISPEKEFVPNLWKIVEILPKSLFDVIAKINKKLLPSGEIDDTASPELARLRREINSQRGRLQKSLEAIMRANSNAIQDAIVTQRNDRFVVPVKSDFRGKISGVAHGFSSSGATMFIEPLEVIEANNELAGLKSKEENEVARILFALTEDLRNELPGIELAVEAVAELDFVRAKVQFARKFNAIVPTISFDETLDLVEARHPILEENLQQLAVSSEQLAAKIEKRLLGSVPDTKPQIVANSFLLTKTNSVMIISGANAGGKTVVMKTAGLLSLMAISGLPVPATSAVIPFYASVLADIGDHQSLSANLSTFSSHISNIADMMQNLNTPSLVLLDEVGTGTDPDEGSALGVAIVDYFRRKGSQIIASTHYKGLKIYATNDEEVINASVEFDEKTLQPTYRLLVGMAGASSGIEIARRFGILPQVIEKSREVLDKSALEASDYLMRLKRETQVAEDLRIALEEEREATAMKYALLDIEAGKREKTRQKEFNSQLSETLESFDKQTKAFLQTIEDKALKVKMEKEIAARKAELKRFVFDAENSGNGGINLVQNVAEAKPKPATIDAPVKVGLKVLTSFGSVGIVEKIDGGNVEVLVGSMRMREKLKNLKVVVSQEVAKSNKLEKLQQQSENNNLTIDEEDHASELNLIGKRTAEADYMLDKFLDESYMNRQPRIRIIHGFGTGAMRNFVHTFLKGNEYVLRYTFAEQNQGGEGATIVELKQ